MTISTDILAALKEERAVTTALAEALWRQSRESLAFRTGVETRLKTLEDSVSRILEALEAIFSSQELV